MRSPDTGGPAAASRTNVETPSARTSLNEYYIQTTSSRAEGRVLKHNDTFAVFDHYGDIGPTGRGEQGIYHDGTRFLSRLELRLGDLRPLLLSSTVKQDNELLAVDLTNPDILEDRRIVVPRGGVHLFRSKFLWEASCYERFRIWNYAPEAVTLSLSLEFDADFADIFEVRGMPRAERGERLDARIEGAAVLLGYRGRDGVVRRTRLECFPPPARLAGQSARYDLHLQPRGSATCFLTVSCEQGDESPEQVSYDNAYSVATSTLAAAKQGCCEVYTSNEQFNDWVNRSIADLRMMVSDTPYGPYPYAGVPWFSTAFGRDGIITAMEMLWLQPALARGVLAYLAATQATETRADQDAEPGKILHETRKGEMAALGEVPFGKYYGSVDATPLFVMLAGSYYDRTADRELIERIWPNIELALRWTNTYGDLDGDGFVEYSRHSSKGLVQQGWKDSEDAVFHADGRLAEAPIALCEVQGYVYAARRAAARLALALGRDETAARLLAEAESLREQFERAFWCEDLGIYALALDRQKRQCRVRTSNAGHCLLAGIASPAHAARVADTLLADDSFSGWGIRTVASSEVRYNPMSYHNGSVWPHDNAVIAAGFARYGLNHRLLKPLTGLFDASLFVELHRLPELFCGFHRRPGEGPTLYPVACAPQAWSTGTVFLMLQACLGLSIDAAARRVTFVRPFLPEFLQQIFVRTLAVGDARFDLQIERFPHDVGVTVLRREGDVEVVVVK